MSPRLVVFCILFLAAIVSLMWAPRSGLQWIQLKRSENQLDAQIAKLEADLHGIEEQSKQLETNRFMQVKAIQDTLGYVRPDETVFQFISRQNAATKSKNSLPH